ncbi:lipopolysaccharide biosynthesis protein [Adhaeribacter aquaticus]|uniref:lipopolysaccharide biosynthesis protein n=1 Tax=Adhaeribacter aquaticus TaxID=299567 RepID=UPI0003F5C710|nr:oligosaccharide flippase family protein [Adhaeribacter aquaticus]
MGIIKRQGIQNSIISYAGVVIGYINVMVLFPRVLAVDQVGLTRLLPNVAIILAQLSALGFGSAGIKYFPFFRDKAKRHNNFLLLLFGIPLLGFLFISGIFYGFKPYILNYFGKEDQLLRSYSYYILPLSFFTLLYNLFTSYLTSLYKTVIPSFTKDFLLRVGTSACVLLYYFKLITFETFLFLFIAVNCSITMVLLVYVVFLKQLHFNLDTAPLQDKPIKPMIRYGLYAFMGNISSMVITLIDSVMISHYRNLASVGIYTTATNVASIILIAGSSIFKIALPQIADFWKSENMVAMLKLYKQVTRINLVIGGLLFIGIWANINNLFSLLPQEYASGKYVIFFICAARLYDLATGINGHILLTSAKYRYDLIFNLLLSGLTIVANMYFIPRYDIAGAAFVYLMVSGLINSLRLVAVWYFYKMQPFTSSSLKIIAIALAAYGAGFWLPYLGNTLLDLLGRSALITIIYGTGIWVFELAPELTDKFQTILLKRKIKN